MVVPPPPRSLRGAALLSAALLSGCDQISSLTAEVEPAPFPVLVRVESDPGKPLANIAIQHQGQTIKSTGNDGTALLETRKPDGTVLELSVVCPADTLPAAPFKVHVRRAEGQAHTEQRVYCKPAIRRVGVAIRADGAPNAAVVYLGQTVARTDESGAAHFAMHLRPGESFRVAIDASADPALRPQRSETIFQVSEGDELFVFSQKFTREVKKKIYRRRGPTGPTRL